MSTSDKTFSQVKAILSKLDQRIDSLRERRTAPPPTNSATLAGGLIGDQLIGTAESPGGAGTLSPIRPNAAQPLNPLAPNSPLGPLTASQPRSPYGRAMPLRNVS